MGRNEMLTHAVKLLIFLWNFLGKGINMKAIGYLGLVAACLTVVAAPSAIAAEILPAYTYTSGSTLSDNRPFTIGFSFSLSEAKTVNALGYNSLNITGPQDIGLWNISGILLASATVTPGSQLVSNFRWTDISPFSLGVGTYVLGGTFTGGLFPSDLQGVSTVSGYTYLSDRFSGGTGLQFPTSSTDGSYGAQGIGLVNVSFGAGAVPEPATWVMLLFGFGAIGYSLRRRKKTVGNVSFA